MNLELGFAAAERSYDVAAAILRELNNSSVRLMTNNPEKMPGLVEAGDFAPSYYRNFEY